MTQICSLFPCLEGLPRFEQRAQHRNSGSWGKGQDQGLERTEDPLLSSESGEQRSSLVGVLNLY
jgi:hypothetical protein